MARSCDIMKLGTYKKYNCFYYYNHGYGLGDAFLYDAIIATFHKSTMTKSSKQ